MSTPVSLVPITLPTKVTLKKYGLTTVEWLEIFRSQNGCCGICGKPFEAGKRINIDHLHVRGWKDMLPERRKTYIRGLLCYTCNRFMLMRGVNSEKLYKGWQYMRNWEVRLTPEKLAAQSGQVQPAQHVVKRRNIRHTDQ